MTHTIVFIKKGEGIEKTFEKRMVEMFAKCSQEGGITRVPGRYVGRRDCVHCLDCGDGFTRECVA